MDIEREGSGAHSAARINLGLALLAYYEAHGNLPKADPPAAPRRQTAGVRPRIPEDSLLGLLAILMGTVVVFIDVSRGGYSVYLGSIPVRALQLGIALLVLGTEFFLRRCGLLPAGWRSRPAQPQRELALRK